mgnify:CR=1 FL=1|tara:strand:- start:80 stop:379 length:300 start_codon:yes stop_codon:yes gene_type:complete
MDSEFIIPAIIYSIGIFGFIVLLIRSFSEWSKSSNNKAKNGSWESKTNHLSHISRIVFLISFIVPIVGGILIFMDNDWGVKLVVFGFLWLVILSKITNK